MGHKEKLTKKKERLYEEIVIKLYKEAKTLMSVTTWLQEEMGYKNKSNCYEMVSDAKKYFSEYIFEKNEDALEECIEILKQNRERASAANNLKEVRESTAEIAKLLSLYIKKIDITTQGEKINIIINTEK